MNRDIQALYKSDFSRRSILFNELPSFEQGQSTGMRGRDLRNYQASFKKEIASWSVMLYGAWQ